MLLKKLSDDRGLRAIITDLHSPVYYCMAFRIKKVRKILVNTKQ